MRCLYWTLTLLGLAGTVWTAAWEYSGEHGPAHWADTSAGCGMKSQSPIDIDTSSAVPDDCLEPITMVNYDETANMKPRFRNNGHTVQVDLPDVNLRIKGGKLPANYRLAQFHFHWGSQNDRGSEHTIDGKASPLEVHLVHYSTEYSTLLQAADKHEGLAVLGFFFKIVPDENRAFSDIINTMDSVKYKGSNVSLSAFSVRGLLPDDLSGYYRYSGSLTTPGCYESVVWSVFEEKIKISQAQLNKFRTMYEKESSSTSNKHIVDNYRPVQPLNGRRVSTSIGAGAGTAAPSTVVFSVAALVTMASMVTRGL